MHRLVGVGQQDWDHKVLKRFCGLFKYGFRSDHFGRKCLTLSTLYKNFSRHFEIVFLFFPENRLWSGCPTDIGLQLDKACLVLVAGNGRGGMFLFLLFFFTFIPVPLSSLPFSFISSSISFLPFSGRQHKRTYKG